MQTSSQRPLYACLSLLLHTLVFALVLSFHFQSPAQIGYPEKHLLKAYPYDGNAFKTSTPSLKRAAMPHHPLTANKAAFALQKTVSIEKKSKATAPQQSQASESLSRSALLTLLHEAIQKQQQYPLIAQQMEREGRVTLSFTLYLNGQIANLHIAHSSGTDSLDQAALAAVRKAAPFVAVNRYLQAPGEYQIDVAFALTD